MTWKHLNHSTRVLSRWVCSRAWRFRILTSSQVTLVCGMCCYASVKTHQPERGFWWQKVSEAFYVAEVLTVKPWWWGVCLEKDVLTCVWFLGNLRLGKTFWDRRDETKDNRHWWVPERSLSLHFLDSFPGVALRPGSVSRQVFAYGYSLANEVSRRVTWFSSGLL